MRELGPTEGVVRTTHQTCNGEKPAVLIRFVHPGVFRSIEFRVGAENIEELWDNDQKLCFGLQFIYLTILSTAALNSSICSGIFQHLLPPHQNFSRVISIRRSWILKSVVSIVVHFHSSLINTANSMKFLCDGRVFSTQKTTRTDTRRQENQARVNFEKLTSRSRKSDKSDNFGRDPKNYRKEMILKHKIV